MKNGSLILGIFLGFFMGMYTPVASKLSEILENQERFEETIELAQRIDRNIDILFEKQNQIVKDRNNLVKEFMKIKPNRSVIVEVREVKNEN